MKTIDLTTPAASEMIVTAGFLPGRKEGQWVRGDFRIIERTNPCCTRIVMPEPVGIPDRNSGAYHYGSYVSYDLLRGNSRVTGSTRIEDILAAC